MHIIDLTGYLHELSHNNNRAWFVMNKPRYDILRSEFLTLVTQLITHISKFDPLVLGCNPKKALFRINRDVRFANDKSPYKTTFSASIVAGDLKKPSQGGGPAYYFHINQDGELFFGVGEYMPPADRLKQIRSHVALNGQELVRIMSNKKLHDSFGGLQTEARLQRPPKGFAADHPYIELIKLKNFIVWQQIPLKGKLPEEVTQVLMENFKLAYPLVRWLRQADQFQTPS